MDRVDELVTERIFYSVSDRVIIQWSPSSLISQLKQDSDIPIDQNSKLNLNVYQITYDGSTLNLNSINAYPNQHQILIANGNANILLDKRYISKDIVFPAVIRASMTIEGTKSSAAKDIGQWTRPFWVTQQIMNVDDLLWENCQNWYSAEPPSVYNNLLQTVFDVPCPPTIGQARTDNSGLIQDNTDIDFFHTQATNCFKQRIVAR